jgi:hypothetical protein
LRDGALGGVGDRQIREELLRIGVGGEQDA